MKIEEKRGTLQFELTTGEGEEEGADALHASARRVREGRHPPHRGARDHRRRDHRRGAAAHDRRHDRGPAQRWHALAAPPSKHPEAFPTYYIGILQLGRAHRQARRDAGEPRRLPRARARDPLEGGVGPVVPGRGHGAGRVHRGRARRLRAAPVQAAVRGAGRRPAVRHPHAARSSPPVHRDVVHPVHLLRRASAAWIVWMFEDRRAASRSRTSWC